MKPSVTATTDEANVTASIPAVTESYQKTHKSYVMATALLASWQLIGITLETKEKWGVSFKSPSAIPLILIILVVYFGYRLTIEWLQCDPRRRTNLPAAIDYRVTHGLAIIALIITLIQYMLRKQVVDFILFHFSMTEVLVGVACIFSTFIAWSTFYRYKEGSGIKSPGRWLFYFLAAAGLISSAIMTIRMSGVLAFVVIAVICSGMTWSFANAVKKEADEIERDGLLETRKRKVTKTI